MGSNICQGLKVLAFLSSGNFVHSILSYYVLHMKLANTQKRNITIEVPPSPKTKNIKHERGDFITINSYHSSKITCVS